VGQYVLSVALLVAGSLAIVYIDRGTAFIDENWNILVNSVIPFTTQLDQKRLFSFTQSLMAWVAFLTAALSLSPMARAWSMLDKRHRLAHHTWIVFLPQLFVIACLALVGLGMGWVGADLTA